jgi:hypothetical protein
VVVVRDHAALLTAVLAFIVFTVVSTATVALTFVDFSRRPGGGQSTWKLLGTGWCALGPRSPSSFLAAVLYLILEGIRGIVAA